MAGSDLHPRFFTKAPFPWFGGKSDAAELVWSRLGDVQHYVEPFFGSGAVLLRRPHTPNRETYSETVNDADALLVNFWRAIQFAPEETARHASYPVSEADLHARTLAVLEWRASGEAERIAGTWDYYDARIAGWWAWCIACSIGLSSQFDGRGAWVRGADGKLTKHNHKTGVHRAHLREPGIQRSIPHISDNGNGVNHPKLRELGISDSIDDASHVATLERAAAEALDASQFHPMIMPKLLTWFAALSARLRHVRIVNGDWTRVLTNATLFTLEVRTGDGVAGVFLDPPYSHSERDANLYAIDQDIAADVREWCLKNGDNQKLRIALAGFDGEGHEILEQHGWTVVEWFKPALLKGGMAKRSKKGHQQYRERIWFSPHCVKPEMTQLMFCLAPDAQ